MYTCMSTCLHGVQMAGRLRDRRAMLSTLGPGHLTSALPGCDRFYGARTTRTLNNHCLSLAFDLDNKTADSKTAIRRMTIKFMSEPRPHAPAFSLSVDLYVFCSLRFRLLFVAGRAGGVEDAIFNLSKGTSISVRRFRPGRPTVDLFDATRANDVYARSCFRVDHGGWLPGFLREMDMLTFHQRAL